MRAKLLQGGTTYGTMAFEFFTPGLMPVLAACGAEWVILDMEHSGAGIDTMKAMIAAARGLSIVPMVRVPGTAYHLIAPVLDAGAAGIMVPMVESAEQAADIAAWCRYPPEGRRGLAFNIAHDDYRGGDPVAKMAAANERTLVIALIETARGIANAGAIMAVPGIDVGWLGHFDLTATMGITGQFEHPDFAEAVATLADACARNGKPAGILANSVAMGRRFQGLGFRCIGFGTDIGLLQSAFGAGVAQLREQAGAEKQG